MKAQINFAIVTLIAIFTTLNINAQTVVSRNGDITDNIKGCQITVNTTNESNIVNPELWIIYITYDQAYDEIRYDFYSRRNPFIANVAVWNSHNSLYVHFPGCKDGDTFLGSTHWSGHVDKVLNVTIPERCGIKATIGELEPRP